ncbi:50S ribosomal protein L18 [Patescibacteria group bacterium]|nr:50S ribosomal protein L18 [Patescibacteria group bacterium]
MNKTNKKIRRQRRTRAKIKGTQDKPRLTVFRSNISIYAQIINDDKGVTLVGISEKEIEAKKVNKTEKAKELGLALAKKALEKKIKNVVFDKGSYSYHGRVKSLADGAREGGLIF